ncbi:efflux RND transporter permease subunit [Aestuariibacter sp. AA17]|uniref:Efflux RND transporter permease subunit n=1 Tax=Fluctibacter corallii TaxID=2984329 RepID=A0ABT3A8A6_9ALTE|nr:efflux RND transporter permease subunit [Aestuariibacter sp. AA17]MCV2884822.1 efflux RND transporter permease subunit [Aestuariibacter sp. AA17]
MIEFCLKYRRIILVICALFMTLGIVSALRMPVQLLPTIERTEIKIGARWQQNAPEDVESQMAVQLENALASLPGLKQMETSVSTGTLNTNLLFEDSADPVASLIATGAKLNQVQHWPQSADEPQITQDGISESETVATLMLYPTSDSDADFALLDETVRHVVIPSLLRIPGISRVDNSFSHRDKVIWVNFDPVSMSRYGITVAELQQRIKQLQDQSGGTIELGKDSVALRFKGQPDRSALSQHIISWREGWPIYLGDIAEFVEGYAPGRNITYKSGREAYYLSLKRGRGSNSFDIVQAIKERISELNAIELKPLGLALGMSLDTSENIERAIAIVGSNLLLGIGLVYLVLFFFIRRHSAALVVIISVPLSICLTLMLLSAFGASLNVISLAGLAFSVGLIIDAAVVVQEAIEARCAAVKNTREGIKLAVTKVAKALFASTLTTLLIFIPIAGFSGDVGQLLADLALTMALAISVSLLVALVVVPILVSISRTSKTTDFQSPYWRKLADKALLSSNTPTKQSLLLVMLVLIPAISIPLMLPPKDLLPNAGDTLLRASIRIPQGRNIETLKQDVADVLIERLKPYMNENAPVAVRSYNLVVATNFAFIVAYPKDPNQLDALITEFKDSIFAGLPEISAYVEQEPMIYFRSSASKQIHLNIHGDDLSHMLSLANELKAAIVEQDIAQGIRITPAADDDAQRLLVYPKSWADYDFGLEQQQLADIVSAYSGGLYAGEFIDGLETYDFYLRGPKWYNPDQLQQIQVLTPNGNSVNLGTLVEVTQQKGPSRLLRLDGQRTVRLIVTPPNGASLGEVTNKLRMLVAQNFAAQLSSQNLHVSFKGSADEFEQAMNRIVMVVALALGGLALVLFLIFGSISAMGRILLTLPIAMFGGAFALWLINVFTTVTLDILTMMGFIISAGLVLNNAILIIAEQRHSMNQGLDSQQALHQAVMARSRAIYISALTSICGMLPLMLSPGLGAQMYRGMATVLVGSMSFSLLFCVFVVAALTQQSSAQRDTSQEGLNGQLD